MKKTLLSFCMTGFLAACTMTTNEEPILVFPEEEFQGTVEVVPLEKIQTQPDEEREKLQSFSDVPTFSDKKLKSGSYVGGLAKELRKELRKTGVQVKEIDGQIDLVIPDKVAFAGNQTKVQDSFESSMSSIAKLLGKYDETMVQIVGYTDDAAPVLVNQEASLYKANVIANSLRSYGIDPKRIITDGAGPENPIANNSTVNGREQNRRVEMTLISLQ
ncbi:MAG: OmpA family protein [Alphaproteobacteria bacterium]|nr:OmpA family protein [Alphaproteobacteria bacterium]